MFSSSLVSSAARVELTGTSLVDHLPIQRQTDLEACRRAPTNDLGDRIGGEIRIARIFALGRINEEDVLAQDQALLFNPRSQFLIGRTGIGGAFQRDDLTGAQIRQQRSERVEDEGKIRLPMLGQRRRHAQDQRVRFPDPGKVGRGTEPTRVGRCNCRRRNMLDQRFASVQACDLARMDIEAEHRITDFRKAQR